MHLECDSSVKASLSVGASFLWVGGGEKSLKIKEGSFKNFLIV